MTTRDERLAAAETLTSLINSDQIRSRSRHYDLIQDAERSAR